MKKTRKGISPVIATVIIVSVAIAISVAVAFWMTGITGLFTRYERIEITNAYAEWYEDYSCWLVVLQLRNSGSDDATIDEIFINGRPHDAWTGLDDDNYGYYNSKLAPSLALGNDSLSTSNDTRVIIRKNAANAIMKCVIPYHSTEGEPTGFDFTNYVPLPAGSDMTIVIVMGGPGLTSRADYNNGDNPVDFNHGASIEVKIHTAAGKEYPKTIVLP